MIRGKYHKKTIICGNTSLFTPLLADIFIEYIALNPISTFFRQLYSQDLASFAGSTIIFFFIAALIIRWYSTKLLHCRNAPGCCSSWGICSLTTVSDSTFFPLPPPQAFFTLFYFKRFMGVSFVETFALSREDFFVIQRVIVTVKRITVEVK